MTMEKTKEKKKDDYFQSVECAEEMGVLDDEDRELLRKMAQGDGNND